MNYKLGDEATCKMCNEKIRFIGPHWEHIGELQPRHPAWPLEQAKSSVLIGDRSTETLSHFQCPTCKGWFSVGDAPENRFEWACPWCYRISNYDWVKSTKTETEPSYGQLYDEAKARSI